MTGIEVARLVTKTRTCHLVRAKKVGVGYDAKPVFTGSKRGWFYLDLFSASAIVAVHDGLNDVNRERYLKLALPRMADVAFKLVKSAGSTGGVV